VDAEIDSRRRVRSECHARQIANDILAALASLARLVAAVASHRE
jgi:hypothetical protein